MSDSLLGGLLVSGFNKDSCMSRLPISTFTLRAYEELHKRCGPGTRPYTNAERLLKPKQIGDLDSEGCKYVVLMEFSGLGNRIISIASAFLCAMLTDRVLVVEGGEQFDDLLFCEPFLDTTWLLPKDFTLANQFSGFAQNSAHFHGDMLKRKLISVSEFTKECAVVDHLGRYLFHPSNNVWGLITRIGLQIRVFDEKTGVSPQVTKQIISCVQSQEVLPKLIKPGEEQKQPSEEVKLKAVILEILKTMYWENPTRCDWNTSAKSRRTSKLMHNRKTWGNCLVYVWVMYKQENQTDMMNPPCELCHQVLVSMLLLTIYDCKTNKRSDTGDVVKHVRYCEDISWGMGT
ncbi:LOW QUALITY PROTEIN: hypothetical protein HID58_033634 [Brassica napus]|uniref:Fucosyltransferase n=1 Tax=Brassica napus TaxID=3708 RepID=A0ABQ8C106_BRANA|nr:LOW QUALITY PROTEIN: hypothetical protein HID58_033634 [Brassica napus]